MPEKLEFQLRLYPDPVLRKVAQPVPTFDEALQATVAAMLERMYASSGVGLAAPQVGLGQRILVLNPTGEPADELALVNVSIVERTGALVGFEEGCLSFPGIFADVQRPERCRIKAWTPTGEPIERELGDFASRIVQHEYDHLEGVLLVDRMSPADKLRHKVALEELVERYRAGAGKAAVSRGR
jgi:peptide deformylase